MKRTTVKLPDELDARLRLEAKRREITLAELTREALEAHLSASPFGHGTRRTLLAAAAGSSGRSDVADRVDELLAEGFGSAP